MKTMLERLKEHLKSPEGLKQTQEYFANKTKVDLINKGRYKRFDEWLKHNDFDNLMYRLILEHGDEWQEKCWHNGCEMYFNNKLNFIYDYVIKNHEPIRVSQLENRYFPTQCWFFKGYYFRIMYGQGSAMDIFNGDDFRHLLGV